MKTTFLHVLCYPVIVSRKYIYVFRSLHLPLDTQFWTRGFPLVIRSRKSGLTLATRARELCPYRYLSRMTRTEYFPSQNLFRVFGNQFSPRFMLPCIVSRKYIYGFSKSAPTPRYTILDSWLPPCNAISEVRLPLSNISSKAGALPSRMTRTENLGNFLSQIFSYFFRNHFSPRFILPFHYKPKIYLRFFEVCTYPSIHNFVLEASPL